jgi:hypothetical protein
MSYKIHAGWKPLMCKCKSINFEIPPGSWNPEKRLKINYEDSDFSKIIGTARSNRSTLRS